MAGLPISSPGDTSPVRFCQQCNEKLPERWKPYNCPRCTAKMGGEGTNYRYVPIWQLAGELDVSEAIIRGAIGKRLLKSKNRIIDGKTVTVVQRQEGYPFRTNKGAAKQIDIPVQYPKQLELLEEVSGYSKLDRNVMLYLLREILAGFELLSDYITEKGE